MSQENKIKALIELIGKEPSMRPQLKARLAQVIKEQPNEFKAFISASYGTQVPLCVKEVINSLHREALKQYFTWFFEAKNPQLIDGVMLVAKFLNPGMKDADILKSFKQLYEQLNTYLDSSYDVFHKAEVFERFIFTDNNFKLESLAADPKLLSLPDIVQRRRATGFSMAVLYALLAEGFDVKASITDIAGKPIVVFVDTFTAEPVYIDVISNGQFVSEEECHIYAASRGLKWDSSAVTPLSNKQIVKRLLNNLIYVFGRAGLEPQTYDAAGLELVRQYLKTAK